MSGNISLRSCEFAHIDHLVEIYRQGFKDELAFFFRRFPRYFFWALFRLVARDTIVAEMNDQIVGFVIVIPGLIPKIDINTIPLTLTFPTLLGSARSSFLGYILQKLRNTDWHKQQLGVACIAVRKEYRGRGIGGALMRRALAGHPKMDTSLEVRSWNESARRLYTSVGFTRTKAWMDPRGQWIAMRRHARCN